MALPVEVAIFPKATRGTVEEIMTHRLRQSNYVINDAVTLRKWFNDEGALAFVQMNPEKYNLCMQANGQAGWTWYDVPRVRGWQALAAEVWRMIDLHLAFQVDDHDEPLHGSSLHDNPFVPGLGGEPGFLRTG